jgi:hypothetical protein
MPSFLKVTTMKGRVPSEQCRREGKGSRLVVSWHENDEISIRLSHFFPWIQCCVCVYMCMHVCLSMGNNYRKFVDPDAHPTEMEPL